VATDCLLLSSPDRGECIPQTADLEIAPLLARYGAADAERKSAGLELGRCLLKWREEYKAQGQAGNGFQALLARMKIPRATAYRLIRAAAPNFVSPETKFNLKLTVARLSVWAKKLPQSLKTCPEETLAQLRDIQIRVNQLLADADHIRRAESGKSCRRKAPLRVSRRSPITQDKLDCAMVGIIEDQLCFAFVPHLHRVLPGSLAAHLAQLEAPREA
jgi:hypothetical protein